MCEQAIADGFKKGKNCEDCDTAQLLPENTAAYEIIAGIDSVLVDAYTLQINFSACGFAVTRQGFSERKEIELMKKILAYAEVKQEWLVEELKKHREEDED